MRINLHEELDMTHRFTRYGIVPLLAACLSAAPATEPAEAPHIKAWRDDAQKKFQRAEEWSHNAEAQESCLRKQLATLREDLRTRTAHVEVSPEAIAQATLKLESLREDLLLERAGAQAREKALAEAIAKYSDRAEHQMDRDPVVMPLREVVKQNELMVKRLEVLSKQGTVSTTDLSTARAALATAEANLAEKRREAALAAGGAQLAVLNRELTQVSITSAERDARLRFIEQELDKLRSVGPMLDQYESTVDRLRRARRALDDARTELDAAERHWRAFGG